MDNTKYSSRSILVTYCKAEFHLGLWLGDQKSTFWKRKKTVKKMYLFLEYLSSFPWTTPRMMSIDPKSNIDMSEKEKKSSKHVYRPKAVHEPENF